MEKLESFMVGGPSTRKSPLTNLPLERQPFSLRDCHLVAYTGEEFDSSP